MPKRVSHKERKQDLAEAVWRVIETDGVDALSMRHIAREANWSLGALAHYFPNKDALLTFAYELAMEREGDRYRREAKGLTGFAALEAACRASVCVTPEACTTSRVWLAFLPRATGHEYLRGIQRREQSAFREWLSATIARIGTDVCLEDEVDAEWEATLLVSFIDGLTLQALLEPDVFTPERQTELVRAYLKGRGLGGPAGEAGAQGPSAPRSWPVDSGDRGRRYP